GHRFLRANVGRRGAFLRKPRPDDGRLFQHDHLDPGFGRLADIRAVRLVDAADVVNLRLDLGEHGGAGGERSSNAALPGERLGTIEPTGGDASQFNRDAVLVWYQAVTGCRVAGREAGAVEGDAKGAGGHGAPSDVGAGCPVSLLCESSVRFPEGET